MGSPLIILTLIGMAVVTYLPRMVPFIMFKGEELPRFIQGILKNVPYATLGALIFPAVFLIREGEILFGVIGMLVSFILAFFGANVIVVVLGSIAILSVYTWLT